MCLLQFFIIASKQFFDNFETLLAAMQFLLARIKDRVVSEHDLVALHQYCFKKSSDFFQNMRAVSGQIYQYYKTITSKTFSGSSVPVLAAIHRCYIGNVPRHFQSLF